MAIISGAYIVWLGIARNLQETVRQMAKRSAKCKRPLAKRRNAPRNARDLPPNSERFREMQESFRQTAKRSAKCKRASAKRRNAPRNARDLPPNDETLREMQETFRQTTKCSAKCKRPNTKWRNAPRNARDLPSAKWQNAPRNARDLPSNGEMLREMQETFCQTANGSAKCKRPNTKWRNAPRNARGGARSVGEGRIISSHSSPAAHPLNQMYCSKGGLCVGRRACRGCGASRRRGPGGRG